MMITLVPKDSIYPKFGVCYNDGRIEIRNDLPPCAISFLAAHEVYHSFDAEKRWWLREIKATLAPFIGFLIVRIMSLSPYRLAYYLKRIKEKR
jgi:hypothetical protein